ncbi:MAG: helix-turn-helix domain-containing protein [Ramlibacter sp.]|nr:helix-turn-helix domain-containing protein [Cryobacterium sp.]
MPTEPLDARTHRVLSGISRVAILDLLRSGEGPVDVPSIAAHVGLHPNTVRSHLDRLVEVGLVTAATEERVRPGRPRLLFTAAAPATAPDDSYRLLAGILAGSLASGAPSGADAAGEAGRRWGDEMARTAVAPAEMPLAPLDGALAVERIVEILDRVGFSPRLGEAGIPPAAEPEPGGQVVIELHACPFLDVAKDHRDVVCSVHRGLMEGALERMHAPAVGVTLEPFARPGVCLAYLALPAAS